MSITSDKINDAVNQKIDNLDNDGILSSLDIGRHALKYLWNNKGKFIYGSSCWALNSMGAKHLYLPLLKNFAKDYPQYSKYVNLILEHPLLRNIAGTLFIAWGLKKAAKLFNDYVIKYINPFPIASKTAQEHGFNGSSEIRNIEAAIYDKNAKGVIKNIWKTMKNATGTVGRISDTVTEKAIKNNNITNNTSFEKL